MGLASCSAVDEAHSYSYGCCCLARKHQLCMSGQSARDACARVDWCEMSQASSLESIRRCCEIRQSRCLNCQSNHFSSHLLSFRKFRMVHRSICLRRAGVFALVRTIFLLNATSLAPPGGLACDGELVCGSTAIVIVGNCAN